MHFVVTFLENFAEKNYDDNMAMFFCIVYSRQNNIVDGTPSKYKFE